MLSILHSDAALLAVDKPAGQLVIPGRGPPEPTVLEAAQAEHGRLWVVHRLDRGTTGVLLFARDAATHAALNLAFDSRRVNKRYVAVVAGAPPDEQRIEVPIAAARRGRMRPGRPGDARVKAAATYVRVLERFPGPPELALVECVPETGRTHQIRVHLAAAGTPLAFDPDYGPRPALAGRDGRPLIDRTPLHAASLALDHPATGAPLRIEAPLPADMAALLERARL
jgi:tRNA pseudouridine32 synthase/23S rRNA pseudouridine746 synthase